jgi:hypothetical protein
LNILVKLLPSERKLICSYVLNLPEFEEKARFVSEVLYRIKEWDCDEAYRLYEKYEVHIETLRHTFHHIMEDAMLYRFEWALARYRSYCLNIVGQVTTFSDKPKFEYDDEQLLKKFFKVNGSSTLDLALELVHEIFQQNVWREQVVNLRGLGVLVVYWSGGR